MTLTDYCINHCGIRTDNEYGVCRICIKKLCIPLDGLRQIEGNFYECVIWRKT